MTLRLLLDEHTSEDAANRLSESFDVLRVVDSSVLGTGTDDDEIWRFAVDHDRAVVTMDRHYIDGTANPGDGTYPGVIYCNTRSTEVIHEGIRNLGRFYSTEELANRDDPVYVPGNWV